MEKLEDIEIKLQALGYSESQINSIIKETMAGKSWSEIKEEERKEIIAALNKRIDFARKFFQFLNCKSCWERKML